MKIYRLLDDINLSERPYHYAAWSGGADSTLMIYDIIKLLKMNNLPKLTTLSSNSDYIGRKQGSAEVTVRKNLKDIFFQKGMEFESVELNVTLEQPNYHGERFINGLPQPGIWLFQFLPFIPNKSVIHFGYIKGDCFWAYMNEFINIIDSYCTMTCRDIAISLPFTFTPKEDILQNLKDVGLLNHIWYCESPYIGLADKPEPCGTCCSCKTHIKGLASGLIHSMNAYNYCKYQIESMPHDIDTTMLEPVLSVDTADIHISSEDNEVLDCV